MCIYIYKYTYIFTHIYIYVCIYVYTYHTYVYTYRIYIYTHKKIYMYNIMSIILHIYIFLILIWCIIDLFRNNIRFSVANKLGNGNSHDSIKVDWEMIKHVRWIRKKSTGDLTQILWQNQKQWCAFLGYARQPQAITSDLAPCTSTVGQLWFGAGVYFIFAYTVHRHVYYIYIYTAHYSSNNNNNKNNNLTTTTPAHATTNDKLIGESSPKGFISGWWIVIVQPDKWGNSLEDRGRRWCRPTKNVIYLP